MKNFRTKNGDQNARFKKLIDLFIKSNYSLFGLIEFECTSSNESVNTEQ